jgi:hypothetical protein
MSYPDNPEVVSSYSFQIYAVIHEMFLNVHLKRRKHFGDGIATYDIMMSVRCRVQKLDRDNNKGSVIRCDSFNKVLIQALRPYPFITTPNE